MHNKKDFTHITARSTFTVLTVTLNLIILHSDTSLN